MALYDHRGRAKCRTKECPEMTLNQSGYCEKHLPKCETCQKVTIYRPGERHCSRCKRKKLEDTHVMGRSA